MEKPINAEPNVAEPAGLNADEDNAEISGGEDTGQARDSQDSDARDSDVRDSQDSDTRDSDVRDSQDSDEPGDGETGGAGADEDGRGLGWLLSLSGLGALTSAPESMPVSAAPSVADDADARQGNGPDAAEPVSGVPTGIIAGTPSGDAPVSGPPVSGPPISATPVSGAAPTGTPKSDWFSSVDVSDSPAADSPDAVRVEQEAEAPSVAEAVPAASTMDHVDAAAASDSEPSQEESVDAAHGALDDPEPADVAKNDAAADTDDVEIKVDDVKVKVDADDVAVDADEVEVAVVAVDADEVEVAVVAVDADEVEVAVAIDTNDVEIKVDEVEVEVEVDEVDEGTAARKDIAKPAAIAAADIATPESESAAPEPDAPGAIAEADHAEFENAAEPEDPAAPEEAADPATPAEATPAVGQDDAERTEEEWEAAPRLVDPEEVLSAYPWQVDPVTLRETAAELDQLRAVRDRLTDKVEYAERDAVRARLLSLRAVVSRVLGEHGRALADAREALRHAEAAGEFRQVAVVQARLALVQQWRGDFAEADRLYAEVNSVELPGMLRAELHLNAGKSCYEQGRYLEACNHFELASELRRGEDPELAARAGAALDAVMARVQEGGWGPYPRSREEVLQQSRPPQPASDHETRLSGYADSDGNLVIPASYSETQPFHEGAAWVRRPDGDAWELVDESGTLLIDATSGYRQARAFSDGLAWVSREDAGGWFAVDWHNRVIVPGGFDDVRPFRHGVAAVGKGGWGALDRHGRVVVPYEYAAFATALTSGGEVEDGFTAEGLAVVEAGGLFGVVDRAGQVLVPPVHARVLIHPVAYVIGDVQGRWGAVDRHGVPLVDVVHAEPADVIREVDRLRAGTRPVL
ncbi:WG repeat-containing protein [Actinoplanes sp. NPDC051859]|uniref:WG repeat-containing protein n=1 Tax=Actinoplanes sp. NPDC051859 TaxID=3363909 RepID=UPI0037B6B5A2